MASSCAASINSCSCSACMEVTMSARTDNSCQNSTFEINTNTTWGNKTTPLVKETVLAIALNLLPAGKAESSQSRESFRSKRSNVWFHGPVSASKDNVRVSLRWLNNSNSGLLRVHLYLVNSVQQHVGLERYGGQWRAAPIKTRTVPKSRDLSLRARVTCSRVPTGKVAAGAR